MSKNYGQREKLHLYHQPRKTKKRGTINNYSIATSYRKDGKNLKKIVKSLGELSADEAARYKELLRAFNEGVELPLPTSLKLDDVNYEDDWHYLNVLTISLLWEKLGFQRLFSADTAPNQTLATEPVARILTVNRVLAPASKIGTIEWLNHTLLAEILRIKPSAYNKTKIFRELGKIHSKKEKIEEACFRFSQSLSNGKFEVYFFDGSTSWFEGSKCKLAKYDLEKTRGYYSKVVGLMLVTDKLGYPVAWDIVDGNTKDTKAIKEMVLRIKNKYGVEEITYCFDRGVASATNFDLLTSSNNKFISGIRDNQIKEVFNLDFFASKIRPRIIKQAENPRQEPKSRRIIGVDGFYKTKDVIFYKDLGLKEGRRYIVSFNVDIFQSEQRERKKNLETALMKISQRNIELSAAKKDRDYNTTERDLISLLAKHRVREFISYSLLPFNTAFGAQSFRIECGFRRDKISDTSKTDGIMVYITDHVEKDAKGRFQLSASDIVSHYRDKYVVENAFRELKSFLDVRPFHVWTEEHVKAHYDIAIIGCFINNFIYRTLQGCDISIRDFYKKLNKCAPAIRLTSSRTKEVQYKIKSIDSQMGSYFEQLGLSEILSPHFHRSFGVSA